MFCKRFFQFGFENPKRFFRFHFENPKYFYNIPLHPTEGYVILLKSR